MTTYAHEHTGALSVGATAGAGPVSIAVALARAMDRAADAALFWGRNTHAERLAHLAAELRERAP